MSNAILEWGSRTYVMGILNITPDSFSGDGLMNTPDLVNAAVDKAVGFEEDGADIIDIGGESTRPGSNAVDEKDEIERILPVIREVKKNTRCIISVDTYKAGVAMAALDAGADWVNDVWAMQRDEKMAPLVVKRNCPVVLMHNRTRTDEFKFDTRLGGMYSGADFKDVVQDVRSDLHVITEFGLDQGIKPENIILDPGIGFGKSVAQNMTLINHLDVIRSLGYPVLLGVSRKSFIGFSQDLPPSERLEGSLAAAVVGIVRGADIIRAHDVKETVRAARLADAVVRGN